MIGELWEQYLHLIQENLWSRISQNGDLWLSHIIITWNDGLKFRFLHPHSRTTNSLWVRGQYLHFKEAKSL